MLLPGRHIHSQDIRELMVNRLQQTTFGAAAGTPEQRSPEQGNLQFSDGIHNIITDVAMLICTCKFLLLEQEHSKPEKIG